MNWSEFFYMGGYAFYVWTSFALAFVVLSANVMWAVRKKHRVLERLKRDALVRGESS